MYKPSPLPLNTPLFLCMYKKAHPSLFPIPPQQNSFPNLHFWLFVISLLHWTEESEKLSRIGDWNCKSCQHLNFQRRDSCQRCGDPKLFGDFASGDNNGRTAAGGYFDYTGSDIRPGDWYCTVGNCGAHNFANRSNCFKCGAFKDDSSGACRHDFSRALSGGGSSGSGRSGWKSGDWI